MNPLDLSIVIPCYRSGPWLDELVEAIHQVLASLPYRFEIVLVNDASPDGTWDAMKRLVERYSGVRAIDLQFNVGQYRATLCGIERARGHWIITMDDDFQHPPDQLPVLIEAIKSHPECDCIMARFRRKQHSLVRNLGSGLMRAIYVRFYRAPRHVAPSSFRIMTSQFARILCSHGTANPVLCPLIFQLTRRVANVEVQHAARAYGKSGYRLGRLAGTVVDTLLRATTYPLHVVCLLGLLIAGGSLLFGVYRVIRYFVGPQVLPGFTTLAVLVTFFGGMILFAVGLVGEYLARVIEEVRGQPRYVVREELLPGQEPAATRLEGCSGSQAQPPP
ncbi:MAG: glycosyl transferase [Pirellulaceae bacterium]|nr:MAG: glycosyl transferase [Pirellulaceae bacterium]